MIMTDNDKLISRLQSLKASVERGKQEQARLEGQLQANYDQLAALGFGQKDPDDRAAAAAKYLAEESEKLEAAEQALAAKLEEIEREIPR
jgi:hypothetical protein